MNALDKLTETIQQLNSQITKSHCTALIGELENFKKEHSDTPDINALANMMQPLAGYIQTLLGKSHPDALPILESTISTASKLLTEPGMDDGVRKDLVNAQITRYRQLQNKLSSSPPVQPSDIENLKAVILAIDWEISDDTLNSFNIELANQLERFKDFNIHRTFLQILNTTGRYVASQKAKAHADSIFFLRSVFDSFEKLILSPGMPLKDKKKLLKKDLIKFQDFKSKITKGQEQKAQLAPPQDDDSDTMPPALSHIKTDVHTSSSNGNAGVLTSLDDDTSEMTPAPEVDMGATGGEDRQTGGGDVMDDLFSVKESPADELLDAIHLMDVQGSSPGNAMGMLDAAESNQSDGAKKYTPQKGDNAPIPEIDSRLDEFFNLEPSAPTNELPPQIIPDQETEEPELSTGVDEELGLIPFDDEEEFEAESDDADDTDTEQIIKRIKDYFQFSAKGPEETDPTSIRDDIGLLKQIWALDPEKLSLAGVIEVALDRLEPQKTAEMDGKPTVSAGKKSLWQKFTSIFSS